MFVGVLRLGLSVVGARSLKDKRRVVHSLKDRLATRLRVSVAEVGELDDPRRVHLGVAVVSNEAAQCDRVLEEAAHYASTLGDAILTDRATEIVAFGEGGRGLQGGVDRWPLEAPDGERDDGDDEDDAGDDDARKR
jgi:uncharacterized protein YlxP (DUF503 family)